MRERESGGCRQTEGQTDAKAAARECDAPDILALKGTERRRNGRRRRERADRKAPKKGEDREGRTLRRSGVGWVSGLADPDRSSGKTSETAS